VRNRFSDFATGNGKWPWCRNEVRQLQKNQGILVVDSLFGLGLTRKKNVHGYTSRFYTECRYQRENGWHKKGQGTLSRSRIMINDPRPFF